MAKPPPNGTDGLGSPTLVVAITSPVTGESVVADPQVPPIIVTGTASLNCDDPQGCLDGRIVSVRVQFSGSVPQPVTFAADGASWSFTGTVPPEVAAAAIALDITATLTAAIKDGHKTTTETATASVTIWLQHSELPIRPILGATIANPSYDFHGDPQHPDWDWAKTIAGGQPWLSNDPPRFEWTQVLEPANQFDDKLVGLAGWAIATHLSDQDVPFTHPFGFDWNLDILVDPDYQPLVAPENLDRSTKDVKDAVNGLGLAAPEIMHVETDQGLMPVTFRAHVGDRVAVFGRWVVDCGHDPFTSEIHPPLAVATARSLSSEATHSTLIARPYLAGQEFGGDSLRAHLLKEVARINVESVFSPPFWDHVYARPTVYNTFSGTHLLHYWVRPAASRSQPTDELEVSFHFTTRTGVAVQLVQEMDGDAVGVWVAMNDAAYKPPPLPATADRNYSPDELAMLNTDSKPVYDELVFSSLLASPFAAPILANGIVTDEYARPVASSVHDSEVVTVRAPELGTVQQHFSVDDDQPYPVYGWLDVQWVRGRAPLPAFVTNVAPGLAAPGDSFVLFAKSGDGRIFANRCVLGQSFQGWVEMEGGGRIDAAPAAAAIGTYMFVAVKGLDGRVWLNQGELGHPFVGWGGIDGLNTDAAPALAAAGDSFVLFAKSGDGRIFANRCVLGQSFQGWVEMEGGGRTDAAPAAAAIGTYMFVAVKGLDGRVWLNQGELGHPFVGWGGIDGLNTDAAPTLAAAGDSFVLFAKSGDGRIFANRCVLGQSFQGWVEMEGGGRTDAAPAAAAIGTYMFVAVKGLDGRVYLNQGELGHPFVGWGVV